MGVFFRIQALKLSAQQTKRKEEFPRDAPVFYPSVAEFLDPLGFINSPAVKKAGLESGIIKIVPPDGWKPEFHSHQLKQTKVFPTKRQVRMMVFLQNLTMWV